MTEPKITREQIERRMAFLKPLIDQDRARIPEAFEYALCALALQALDMQPRPIEEAPKDGTKFLALEYGRLGWYRYECWWEHEGHKQFWMDECGGDPNPSHFIPLSSLSFPESRT